jgi:hypothetical protein
MIIDLSIFRERLMSSELRALTLCGIVNYFLCRADCKQLTNDDRMMMEARAELAFLHMAREDQKSFAQAKKISIEPHQEPAHAPRNATVDFIRERSNPIPPRSERDQSSPVALSSWRGMLGGKVRLAAVG